MISDFRFALRRIWNTPGPTAIVLGTLSLTIAAATVVYSTIDIIYHLMPIANRDRMVFIASVDARRNESMRLGVSAADLVEVTRQATTLEAVGAFTFDSAILTGMVVPVRVSTLRVTPNLPALWGLLAAEGRLVQVEDGRPGAEKVAVLTHAFWQREFGTDPAVVGRTVRVNDEPHTRAGCVPCASRIWNNPASLLPVTWSPRFSMASCTRHCAPVLTQAPAPDLMASCTAPVSAGAADRAAGGFRTSRKERVHKVLGKPHRTRFPTAPTRLFFF